MEVHVTRPTRFDQRFEALDNVAARDGR